MIKNFDELHEKIKTAETKAPSLIWKALIPAASYAYLYWFGWELSAMLLIGSMIILHLIMSVLRD